MSSAETGSAQRTRLGRLVTNTSATIIVRAGSGVVRLLLIFVARVASSEEFGRLSLALAFAEVFKVLCDAGLSTVAVRRFAIGKPRAPVLMRRLICLNLAFAIAGYLLMPLVYLCIYGKIEKLLFVVGLMLLALLPTSSLVAFFQAQLQMRKAIPGSAAGGLATATVLLTGIMLGWPIVALAAAIPLGAVIELTVTAGIYSRVSRIAPRIAWRAAARMLREGMPIMVAGVMVVTYSRIDAFVLALVRGEDALGRYAAAFRLVDPFTLIFSSFSLSLYAALSRAWAQGDIFGARRTLLLAVIGVGTLAGALSLAMWAISTRLIEFVYGAHPDTHIAHQILSWTVLVKGLNFQLTMAINSRGKYAAIACVAAVNLVASLVLHTSLIPVYGVAGAAGAALSTEMIGMALQTAIVAWLF